MVRIAKEVAAELVAEFGTNAHERALALAEATGAYGARDCAAFYKTVADIIRQRRLVRLAAA